MKCILQPVPQFLMPVVDLINSLYIMITERIPTLVVCNPNGTIKLIKLLELM